MMMVLKMKSKLQYLISIDSRVILREIAIRSSHWNDGVKDNYVLILKIDDVWRWAWPGALGSIYILD
jgi:hypothetical protein